MRSVYNLLKIVDNCGLFATLDLGFEDKRQIGIYMFKTGKAFNNSMLNIRFNL
jgi:hypothetical protein